jgi:hypothetical protein
LVWEILFEEMDWMNIDGTSSFREFGFGKSCLRKWTESTPSLWKYPLPHSCEFRFADLWEVVTNDTRLISSPC